MEAEILKETVEYGQSRKWIAYAPLLPKDGEWHRSAHRKRVACAAITMD
ncbi:IS2 repressor TnpA [Edwardsiella piscicida]|nr:IS2 repressor TnpA [Edwardsiella piscicida]